MLKSLSARLLIIFIVGFIVLISLLSIGVGHSFKNEIRELHARSVLRFTHIILERGTEEVDFNRAARVAQRANINIYIHTAEQKWSSQEQDINENNYRFSSLPIEISPSRTHRESPPIIQIADGYKNNIYKIITPKATLFFEIENKRKFLSWHFFVITGFFILFLYLAIRYQFAPVAEIKRVVQQVSQGNFKARVETDRNDDLGQLAQQVNRMAADIDRSMESKRSLLLGISHELRTPLTRAKISSEMLEDNKNRESFWKMPHI